MIVDRIRAGWPTIAGIILGLLAALPAVAAERSPNIVLLVADDLGWGDVGFNGRTEWATPELDNLARRGIVLARCYSAATVCAPSRAAFLTGKYTIHSGVRRNDEDLPAEEVTIAEALKPRGYGTGLFGKWHHGRPRQGQGDYVHPMDQGFDEFFGFTDATHAWEKFPTTLWDGRGKVDVSGYVDDLVTDRAIEFLGRRKAKPFFLYVAFVASHFAIEAPDEEVARHRGKLPESDPARPLNATYTAMVTRLDRNVGKLVEKIERLGLTNDTLIFFTSDNGATFEKGNQGTSIALDSNRPFRGQKRTLWEGGIRVPGVVCWPGRIPASSVSHEVVHLTDLLPTFVAAAGGTVEPSWKIDGVNLLPSWSAKARVPERTVFWEWQGEGVDQLAAMRGNEKLVVTRGGKPELFDVERDRAERQDLSATRPESVKRLLGELKAWMGSEFHRDQKP